MKCACPTSSRRRYRWVVTLEAPDDSATPDAAGQIDLTDDDNWSTKGTIKVNFKSLQGSERIAEDRLEAKQMHTLETRSTGLSRSILPAWRLKFDNRTFNVTSAYDVDEMRDVVRIHATEDR